MSHVFLGISTKSATRSDLKTARRSGAISANQAHLCVVGCSCWLAFSASSDDLFSRGFSQAFAVGHDATGGMSDAVEDGVGMGRDGQPNESSQLVTWPDAAWKSFRP